MGTGLVNVDTIGPHIVYIVIYIYNTNSNSIVSSIYIVANLKELLLEYDKSKTRYDYWLTISYEKSKMADKRVTEEEIKLAARNTLRSEGLRDPDTIRWDLKIALGTD